MKKLRCCLCGKEFEGWGNNPAPAKLEGQCCDECNMGLVIPIRMLVQNWVIANELEQRDLREEFAESNADANVGDAVIIFELKGEKNNDYLGRFGIITDIDDLGQLHGTWGSLAVIPNEDTYIVSKITEQPYEEEQSGKTKTSKKATC